VETQSNKAKDTLRFCPIEECLIGFVWRRTVSPRLLVLFMVGMPETNVQGNSPACTQTEAASIVQSLDRMTDNSRLGWLGHWQQLAAVVGEGA
jgi:hypothetical protein